jgi:hypothetical protein
VRITSTDPPWLAYSGVGLSMGWLGESEVAGDGRRETVVMPYAHTGIAFWVGGYGIGLDLRTSAASRGLGAGAWFGALF